MLCMGRRLKKITIRSVNHVFWAYLNHSLSDIYIENILGYLYIGQMVLQVGPKHTRKISQTKSFFPNGGFDRYICRKYPVTRPSVAGAP